MAYKIDSDGTVDLGGTRVPVPMTISEEARTYLASPPWADAPAAEGPAAAMWETRAVVDAALAQLNDFAHSLYPVEIEEIELRGVRCHLVKPLAPRPTDSRRPVLINMHG